LYYELKKKAIQSDGFFFLLFNQTSACDIMILISSAYRLSGAKLVVYKKKQPEWLFFRCKRHEASIFAVSPQVCSHVLGSLKLPAMPPVPLRARQVA
jgi:hypothetical protein